MDFTTFLGLSGNPSWWQTYSVISCSGPEYPVLFFSYFMNRCKKNGIGSMQVIDLNDAPTDNVSALLSSTFLGARNYYWLKNISELDAKKRSYWISYIKSYAGPNCLVVFCNNDLSSHANSAIINIEIPDQCDQNTAATIFKSLMPNDSRHCLLIVRALFKRRRKISFDSICLLINYVTVAGADIEWFISDWLDNIIIPESSLFDLSKYLFARNQEAFFKVWSSMANMYGDLFWVAYWGDVFWRAYNFSRLSGLGQYEQAKKFASRLPFTFIQGGWRQISLDELKGAMSYTYALDSDIKNGIQGSLFLELLYLKFFLRHFDKSFTACS